MKTTRRFNLLSVKIFAAFISILILTAVCFMADISTSVKKDCEPVFVFGETETVQCSHTAE